MKFLTLSVTTLLAGTFAAASAQAIAISEVAELQFHKVNQLVATRKIDSGFVDHMKSVALAKDPAGPLYLVTFQEEADAGQAAFTVVVSADANGKSQGYQQQAGTLAKGPANWGGKAPLDLLEKAVEYVVDSTTDPLTPSFRDGFTAASIEPFQSANGLVGKVSVTAGTASGTLLVFVDLNGQILSTAKQ